MPWQNLSALCHLVHGSDLNYGVDVHLLRQAGMIHPGLGYHRRARLDLSLIRLEYHGIQVMGGQHHEHFADILPSISSYVSVSFQAFYLQNPPATSLITRFLQDSE